MKGIPYTSSNLNIRASDIVSIDLLVDTQFKCFTTDNVELWARNLHWFVFSTTGLQYERELILVQIL